MFRLLRWLLLLLLFLPFAWAGTIVVSTNPEDESGQLELRNIILPSGEKLELWIVKASPVTITIDDKDTIVANEIEIDKANNILRIIGYGVITTEQETIRGDNLVFELDGNVFHGNDVFVFTEAMDILGTTITRVPGQIDVETGHFSPCSRCKQSVEDYGFNAANIELYPGDRLVAFDVVVLIRGLPVFYLPLIVFPLGPDDRKPNLTIKAGTETEKANIFLDWPYVSGASAYGRFSIRYYADIDPKKADYFTNKILGGKVLTGYVGAEIDHIFFTETGKGDFSVAFTPGFLIDPKNPKEKTEEEYKFQFKYDTLEELPILQEHFLVSRDDSSRSKIIEYNASIKNTTQGIIAELTAKGYFDLDRNDATSLPSYDAPLQELKFSIAPEKQEYILGPFSLTDSKINLGFFEDHSNPANRSAAMTPIILAARLLEQHRISLSELKPWLGLLMTGHSDFLGQYYSTDERLINWNSSIDLVQDIDTLGKFRLSFVRNINEGETPFRFDTLSLHNTIYSSFGLELKPADWFNFSISSRYIFLDNRRKELGFDPIISNLSFFDNADWISLTLNNEYNIRDDDPGKLTTTLELRSPPANLETSLSISFIKDLKVTENRLDGKKRDESELSLDYLFSIRPYISFDVSAGYYFDPIVSDTKLPKEFYKDLIIGLNIGTEDKEDLVPELRVSYTRDLNKEELKSLDLTLNAEAQPIVISLNEGFNFQNKSLSSSEYRIGWKNIAVFEAKGFALLPPDWLGLELNQKRTEYYKFNLFEDRNDDSNNQDSRWRVSYNSELHFYKDKKTERKNTNFEIALNLEEQKVDDIYFGVELKSRLILKDDFSKINYLDSARLVFFSDFYEIIGLQGNVGYKASVDGRKIKSADLVLEDVALTIKFFDQLYFSTILNDTWIITGTPKDQAAYNFQPEFRLLWDRCCWLAYASWDTQTGAIKITLTTPNGKKGIKQDLETDLVLPGNHKKK